MANSATDFFNKKVTFIQHKVASLDAGDYDVKVTQELVGKNPDDDINVVSTLTKIISVQAPRLRLSNQFVSQIYPLAYDKDENTEAGPYDTCLPHITLRNNPALPWLRTPTLEKLQKEVVKYKTAAGVNKVYDKEVPSWLAVLVIQETDGLTAQTTATGEDRNADAANKLLDLIQTDTVNNLIPVGFKATDYKLPGIYEITGSSYIDGALPSDTTSLFREKPGGVIPKEVPLGTSMKPNELFQYLDLDISFFQSIAPTLNDLPYLAHLRQVDVTSTATALGDTPTDAIEDFSVVLGNRVPTYDSAGKNMAIAVLVSLEHLENILPGGTSSSTCTKVRLPVLHAWPFKIGQDNTKEFEQKLESLNGADPTNPTSFTHPQLNLVDSTAHKGETTPEGVMERAMRKGYVPFNHITRGTDDSPNRFQTVSWYRGPLVPYQKPTGNIAFQDSELSPNVHSADALLRYDKGLGMLDVSYAAAWQLGKLLALNDKKFAQTLYRWKRETEQHIIAELEKNILIGGLLGSNPPEVQKGENTYHKLNHATAQYFTKLIKLIHS